MSLTRTTRSRTVRRGDAVILFNVASHVFGISASAIDEIRCADALTPFVPSARLRVPNVRCTMMHEGRTVFVVDAGLHFGISATHPARVLLLCDVPVGLAVGQTHRIVEVASLHPLPSAFTGMEREWYRGLALIGEDVVPVLNHSAFLDDAQLERLRLAVSSAAATKGATA